MVEYGKPSRGFLYAYAMGGISGYQITIIDTLFIGVYDQVHMKVRIRFG